MMGMDVTDLSAPGGAVHGAVVLFVIEMKHAGREEDGESEDRALFHLESIIPWPPPGVNHFPGVQPPPA